MHFLPVGLRHYATKMKEAWLVGKVAPSHKFVDDSLKTDEVVGWIALALDARWKGRTFKPKRS